MHTKAGVGMRCKKSVGFQMFASVLLALLALCGPAGANDVGRGIDATGFHAPVAQGLGIHALRDNGLLDNGLAHASANGLLHDIHSSAGLACAACHARVPPEPAPGFQPCIACHGTMIDETHPAPAEGPDPHRSPHLAVDEVPECTTCHQVHRPSEATCSMCHRAMRFDMR